MNESKFQGNKTNKILDLHIQNTSELTPTNLQTRQRYPEANIIHKKEAHLSSSMMTVPSPMTTTAEALQSNPTRLAFRCRDSRAVVDH